MCRLWTQPSEGASSLSSVTMGPGHSALGSHSVWDELGVCGSCHHFVLVWLRGGKSWVVVPWAPFKQPVLAFAEMETSFVDEEKWLALLLQCLLLAFTGCCEMWLFGDI